MLEKISKLQGDVSNIILALPPYHFLYITENTDSTVTSLTYNQSCVTLKAKVVK